MTHKKLLLSAALVALTGTLALSYFASVGAIGEGHSQKPAAAERSRVDERKAQLMERLEIVKSVRTEKLDQKRLDQCEKRQDHINDIFDKATEQNQKQLAVIQKIEERVKAFYVDNNISAAGYDTAVRNADETEAAAIAAIEASQTVTFDCATTSSAKPGSVIKEAMQARHSALKNYRTAVKDLILAVKQRNGQNRSADVDNTPAQQGAGTETNEATTGREQ